MPSTTRPVSSLAEPVTAGEPVPPFDNTAMDGFAVRAADTAAAPVELARRRARWPRAPIPQVSRSARASGAHHDRRRHSRRCRRDRDGRVDRAARRWRPRPHRRLPPRQVTTSGAPATTSRRATWSSTRGTTLTPVHLGVLASVGVADVVVVRRARVGVLSTGDELVEGDAPLATRTAAGLEPALAAARSLASDGFEVVDLGLVRDDKEAVSAAIRGAAAACDALLTSGGVSMGDFDEVKAALVGHRRGHAVDADGHPSRQAVRLRHRRRRCRCSDCRAIRCRRSSPTSCSPVPRCGR